MNVLLPMVAETENVVKNMLNSAIAFGITIDGWQSGPGDSYESLILHWIQETYITFELKSSVLGTIPIDERHTGENVNMLTFLKKNFHYVAKYTKVKELINISETEPIEN